MEAGSRYNRRQADQHRQGRPNATRKRRSVPWIGHAYDKEARATRRFHCPLQGQLSVNLDTRAKDAAKGNFVRLELDNLQALPSSKA